MSNDSAVESCAHLLPRCMAKRSSDASWVYWHIAYQARQRAHKILMDLLALSNRLYSFSPHDQPIRSEDCFDPRHSIGIGDIAILVFRHKSPGFDRVSSIPTRGGAGDSDVRWPRPHPTDKGHDHMDVYSAELFLDFRIFTRFSWPWLRVGRLSTFLTSRGRYPYKKQKGLPAMPP